MGYLPKSYEIRVATAATISSLIATAAFSQDRTLEEIVVTAERRAATEATTAISIEVLTDDFIASNQIKDIVDLQNAVPGLQFFQNGIYVQANIRGVGNPSQGGPSEQVGVPVFFDGATQGEEIALSGGFFDISDVQILRGPQATFVGQSAVGGAILINSARPTLDGLDGFAEVTGGTYGQRKFMGAVNLALGDKVAARFAVMSENRDSFYTNTAGRTVGGGPIYVPGKSEDQNYRVSLLWEPNDKFSLWTKLEQSELHAYGVPQQPNPRSFTTFIDDDNDPLTPSVPNVSWTSNFQGPAPGTGTVDPMTGAILGGTPGPGGVLYDPLDPFTLAQPAAQDQIQTNQRVSLEINYTFDSGISFRSLTSDIQGDRLEVTGGDSLVAAPLGSVHLGPGMRSWSQEFNLISAEGQRLEWLVGLYTHDRHTELNINIPFSGPNGLFGAPCGWQYDRSWTPCPTTQGPRNSALYWHSFDDVIHKAAFGQLKFGLSDELELTFELRHNDDDNTQRRFTHGAFTIIPGVIDATIPSPFAPVPCAAQIGDTTLYCPDPLFQAPPELLTWNDTQTTGKIGLNWEPVDGHFFYAFFARGYKSGQSITQGSTPIIPEIVNDIELGWKGTLLDGQLYAELGIYSMDYENMQIQGFRPDGQLAYTGVAINAASASTIEGIEGSIRYLVGGFGINGTVGYANSKLGGVTIVDANALPFDCGGPFSPCLGDINNGCVGALSTVCFDYAPYAIFAEGTENPFAPKVTYTVSFDYQFTLGNGATLTPSVSFNHADATYTNILQRPGDLYYRTDDRDLVNFSLTYDRNDWQIQLFGTNVSDEILIEGTSVTGASVLYGDPEVWGVRARISF
jgi:iron complex outermembrane receptor protein